MRKPLLSLLVAALLLGLGGLRSAHTDSPEDRKPLAVVAVVAFAGAGELLDGLCGRYDLAVHLYVCYAPEEYQEEFLPPVRRQGDELLKRLPGEDEQAYDIGREAAKRAFKAFAQAVDEIEHGSTG